MGLRGANDEESFLEPGETKRHAVQAAQAAADRRVPVVAEGDETRDLHFEGRGRKRRGGREQLAAFRLELAARAVGKAAIERR
jgi:hypothetical protein